MFLVTPHFFDQNASQTLKQAQVMCASMILRPFSPGCLFFGIDKEKVETCSQPRKILRENASNFVQRVLSAYNPGPGLLEVVLHGYQRSPIFLV
jgi:hypothetical protein